MNRDDPSCSRCVHSRSTISDVEAEGQLLKCHRYPPVLFVLDDELRQGHPDAVEACGEHAEISVRVWNLPP